MAGSIDQTSPRPAGPACLIRRLYRIGLLTGLLLAAPAVAQPEQPVPRTSTPVGEVLAASPQITISNGLIVARIALPDLKHGFYRGTRFDQAGVVTSLTFKGRNFYHPWFDRLNTEVLDYTYDAEGRVVGGPDSAASGPVEEFAPLGFEDRPGAFVKIGVGVLRQPDSQPYDHYRHYKIEDVGKRTTKVSRSSITFTQTLSSNGIAYVYEKTLRLVSGKPELVIEHRLKNTGSKVINTSVYDHNFLTLKPGNAGVRVTFPFNVTAASPPPIDLVQIDGKSLTYLRPMKKKERISFLITGFGNTAEGYDFTVTDTVSDSGVRVRGDQPITRANIFSIDKVQAVEPYVAIDLKSEAEKLWRYRYIFTP